MSRNDTILQLHREGQKPWQIAKFVGVSHTTVQRVVDMHEPLRSVCYDGRVIETTADGWEDTVLRRAERHRNCVRAYLSARGIARLPWRLEDVA